MYTDFTRRMYKPGLVTYRLSSSNQWRFAVREGSRLADFEALCWLSMARCVNYWKRVSFNGPHSSVGRRNQCVVGNRDSFGDLLFGPPLPDPDKILCIGLNYREHAREAGLEVPPVPVVFAKFRNSLIRTRGAHRDSDDQSAD